MVTRKILLVLGLALTPFAAWSEEEKKSGELTDPVEILKKVDEATKAVKAVQYDVEFEGTGAAAARAAKGEGTYLFTGVVGTRPQKYRADIKIKRPDSEEVQHLTGGSDGDVYFLIDHANKKAYEDIDPAVIGTIGRPLQAGLMVEFVHETPFTDEINATKHELRGSKTIGGEDCYEIHVGYANQAQEATWYFSKKDFLPRGRIDFFRVPNQPEGGQQKFLKNLKVDPPIDADAFKLKLPEGYTKTDDFAP